MRFSMAATRHRKAPARRWKNSRPNARGLAKCVRRHGQRAAYYAIGSRQTLGARKLAYDAIANADGLRAADALAALDAAYARGENDEFVSRRSLALMRVSPMATPSST